MHDGKAWLEARSTVADVLGDLPVEWGVPGEDDAQHAGIFSLVVDKDSRKTRALPSLYHGNAQIFVDRDVREVARRLGTTVTAVIQSSRRATYLMTACRVEERTGLYAHDICNRDPFRLRAKREGLVFSEEPHLRMNDDGTFETDGWPAFQPEFIVVNPVAGRDPAENTNKGALLTFLFGILRLGAMTPGELRAVADLVRTTPVLAARDPEELAALLGTGPSQA